MGSYDGLVSISSLIMGVAGGYAGGSVMLCCFLSSTIIEFVPFRHLCACVRVCVCLSIHQQTIDPTPIMGRMNGCVCMYFFFLTIYKQKGEEADPSFSPLV